MYLWKESRKDIYSEAPPLKPVAPASCLTHGENNRHNLRHVLNVLKSRNMFSEDCTIENDFVKSVCLCEKKRNPPHGSNLSTKLFQERKGELITEFHNILNQEEQLPGHLLLSARNYLTSTLNNFRRTNDDHQYKFLFAIKNIILQKSFYCGFDIEVKNEHLSAFLGHGKNHVRKEARKLGCRIKAHRIQPNKIHVDVEAGCLSEYNRVKGFFTERVQHIATLDKKSSESNITALESEDAEIHFSAKKNELKSRSKRQKSKHVQRQEWRKSQSILKKKTEVCKHCLVGREQRDITVMCNSHPGFVLPETTNPTTYKFTWTCCGRPASNAHPEHSDHVDNGCGVAERHVWKPYLHRGVGRRGCIAHSRKKYNQWIMAEDRSVTKHTSELTSDHTCIQAYEPQVESQNVPVVSNNLPSLSGNTRIYTKKKNSAILNETNLDNHFQQQQASDSKFNNSADNVHFREFLNDRSKIFDSVSQVKHVPKYYRSTSVEVYLKVESRLPKVPSIVAMLKRSISECHSVEVS